MRRASRNFLSGILESYGSSHPLQPYDFGEKVLVSPPNQFNMHSYGGYLRLYPNTVAVLYSPTGTSDAYRKGGMLYLNQGVYTVRYVDIRQQTTSISNIQANSTDAWHVNLALDFTWEVLNPIELVTMRDPYETLTRLCQDAAIHYIQTQSFEKLIPTPNKRPIKPETPVQQIRAYSEKEIADSVLVLLRSNPALRAFRFITVNLRDRRGDPRQTEAIQAAMVKNTEIIQEKLNEIEQTNYELEALQKQMPVKKAEESIMVQDAHADRMQRQEAEELSAYEADLERRIIEITKPVREIQIELQNKSREQQISLDRYMRWLEVTAAAYHDLSVVLTQAQMTPGLVQSLENNKAFEQFQNAFSFIKSNNPIDSTPSSEGELHRILPPIDIDDLKD